jgi:hypothetical protein
MSNRIRRGLFAAAGLIGGLAAGPARADGDIEKPPGVPPEVCAARTACPTLTGPCYGYYPTRWRVLPGCCAAPGPAAPAPERPTEIPPAARLRAAAAEKTPTKPEVVPVVSKPMASSVGVIPPSPRAEPPCVPDVIIPPAQTSKPAPTGNRPASAEVVPDTSRLRK